MQTTTTPLEALAAEYDAAEQALTLAASAECTISALRSIGGLAGASRIGRERFLADCEKYGFSTDPTDDEVASFLAKRIALYPIVKAAGTALYRALLEEGVAYEVVDHSARLATRPFEVRPASPTYAPRSFVSAHGSHLHLARYATAAAAEKAIEKLVASEIARLDSEAGR